MLSLIYVTVLNDNPSPLKDLVFQCHGRPNQKVLRNNLVFSITIISSPDIDAATELAPEYVLLCLKRRRIYKGFFNRGLQQLWDGFSSSNVG
jgi:hypothetical protein